MDFQSKYEEWLKYHQANRKGERLRRLLEGHAHAEKLFIEKVWWPAFRQFELLHPEYEVQDFKNGVRYLDFAYIHPGFRVAIEVDGFNAHYRELNRWQFSDQLRRQNHLVIDGWQVMRFTYDDVESKPRVCQQELQQLLGKWFGEDHHINAEWAGRPPMQLAPSDKEIIRLAIRLNRPITPGEVSSLLGVSNKVSRRMLQSLVHQNVFRPASNQLRTRYYQLCLDKQYLLQRLL